MIVINAKMHSPSDLSHALLPSVNYCYFHKMQKSESDAKGTRSNVCKNFGFVGKIVDKG